VRYKGSITCSSLCFVPTHVSVFVSGDGAMSSCVYWELVPL